MVVRVGNVGGTAVVLLSGMDAVDGVTVLVVCRGAVVVGREWCWSCCWWSYC